VDLSQRIDDLHDIADGLCSEASGGWLARSIADGVEAEMAASKPPTPAEAIAELITSGLVGRHLQAALWRHFATASRGDVFLGIALAATIFEGKVTLAELERAIHSAETPVAT
jgi:hypothetical protein